MNIKILYDSKSINKNLDTGWGFSCLVNDCVLFDTGESEESLFNNLNKMSLDVSSLEAVVLSHDHWDHVGGLEYILKNTNKLKIYICPGFDDSFKAKLSKYSAEIIELDYFTRISSGIYSTGQIIGSYKDKDIAEQALIIQTEKGFSVITGCAHPGIVAMLRKIKMQLSLDEFYAVFGGFHLKNSPDEDIKEVVKNFVELKVKRVGATHCSGTNAEDIFKEVYGNNFFDIKVGSEILV